MNKAVSLVKNAVKARPITFMGLLCLCIAGLYVQQKGLSAFSDFFDGFTDAAPYVLGAAVVLAMAFWGRKSLHNALCVLVGTLLAVMGALWIDPHFLPINLGMSMPRHPAAVVLALGLAALLSATLWLWVNKKLTPKRAVGLLIAVGFLLRLVYVLYTPVSVRQHDVWNFSYGDFKDFTYQRHAEYIEYIAAYLKLPSVDPTTVGLSQLYHPPFHHILAGLWLRLNTALGVGYTAACENIQLLTLFYSSACMVIVYRILRLLSCKKWGLLLPMAVICFHPTFIIMAGSVNNDLLSITLALYGVYAALRWYKNPTVYNIVTTALGIGLSMMTKLSGGLVAVGVALLFLVKWLQAIAEKQGKRLFWQFALFGVICVPLALWWQVKNAVLYGLPLTYVPALGENSGQYLGDYSVVQRLFEVQGESLSRIFMAWQNDIYQSSYNEYNLFLSFLKTSVFGEFTLFNGTDSVNTLGNAFAHILFWANAALVGLSLYAGVRCVIRHRKSPVTWCFVLIFSVFMASYIQFCFAYPQACTQNFRYAVPTLLCGLAALGVHVNHCAKGFKVITGVCTAVFCLASAGVYGLLAAVPMW